MQITRRPRLRRDHLGWRTLLDVRARLIQLILQDWAAGGHSPSARAAARASLGGSLPGSSALYRRSEDWPE
ncbi:MAG: hypothetical protein ACR2FV_05065 [Ornithinimicrobium sp.]|uniref:hypothetical protein n=1 Tax=Ornithinimicrobium sp. TaxID=1977084 RepID=UPI003D9B38CE